MKIRWTTPPVLAVALGLAAWGAAQAAVPAHPGMLNYVEGAVTLNGDQVDNKAVGSADLKRNDELSTGQGKAEILLTPGVFLRLNDNSAVRMISPGLTDTRLELTRGQAMIEVANLEKENRISVLDRGVEVVPEKKGLYAMDADNGRVRVFDGKLDLLDNDQKVEVKKGREMVLGGALPKPEKFDRDQAKDSLYQWSSVRSKYLSEAAEASARTVIVNNGGWYGGGWYWSPWGFYSWLPADGMFYSPFGWGFASPLYYRPDYVWHGPRYGPYPHYRTAPVAPRMGAPRSFGMRPGGGGMRSGGMRSGGGGMMRHGR